MTQGRCRDHLLANEDVAAEWPCSGLPRSAKGGRPIADDEPDAVMSKQPLAWQLRGVTAANQWPRVQSTATPAARERCASGDVQAAGRRGLCWGLLSTVDGRQMRRSRIPASQFFGPSNCRLPAGAEDSEAVLAGPKPQPDCVTLWRCGMTRGRNGGRGSARRTDRRTPPCHGEAFFFHPVVRRFSSFQASL